MLNNKSSRENNNLESSHEPRYQGFNLILQQTFNFYKLLMGVVILSEVE